MKNLVILLLCNIIFCANSFAASIFTPNSQPTGWISPPALSNLSLLSNSEFIYLLNYDKDNWSGDVFAKNISNAAVTGSAGPWGLYTVASRINSMLPTDRKIITFSGGVGIPFRIANLTANMTSSLSSSSTAQPKILDYVRGSQTDEAPPNGTGSYRTRTSVLGDILHSTLLYRYHNANTKRLYFGTNDGMLHVVDATDGSEVFAYIPSMLIPNLNLLTIAPYIHQYFVDGGISIANVNNSGTVTTYLVGGLGAGGKGLYGLDVTTPSAVDEAAAAQKIKWEISSNTGGYLNLGYTYGTSRIARLNTGTAVAIVGNGYMNNGNGHATLYIINVATGALIKEIDTGFGSTSSPDGLSTPTLYDSNSDGLVDYAYAGDLDGHLLKFDLTGNDSSNYSSASLFTTNPVLPITSAPAVISHPSGGQMIAFATGRMLSTGDTSDASTVNYAYGIWDRPINYVNNSSLLTQTLTTNTFNGGDIRTVTANAPNWSAGNSNHYGWKVALPIGERVTGELPFEKNGRFYFLTANPAIVNTTLPNGSNWTYELDMITGGSPSYILFDLNEDGAFNNNDLANNCTVAGVIRCIPIAKPVLGPLGEVGGVSSQPIFVEASGYNTTLYTYHPDTFSNSGTAVYDPGVSGGHFDFDNYYYGNSTSVTVSEPSSTSQVRTGICAKESDVILELNGLSPTYCTTNNYTWMTAYAPKGSDNNCKNKSNTKQRFDITCNRVEQNTRQILGDYLGPFSSNKQGQLHVHEYDDIYDVTGVNMLNASDVRLNLANAISSTTTEFKVLVMNQYLNPAANISVGGATYESVKTYKNLASETDASTLLSGLTPYTRGSVNTLILNLPFDTFKSKDWWGDGDERAGLIPTVYSCVTYVNTNGTMKNSNNQGLIGPNGERFDGALAIQIIKSNTPSDSLELNFSNTGVIKNGDGTTGSGTMTTGDRAKYGWRVKAANFNDYVLAEYTIYWHHPNGKCYGKSGWIQDAPEDTISDATAKTKAVGSADPMDGIFVSGLAVSGVPLVTNTNGGSTVSGGSTITTTTFVNGQTTVVTATNNGDGTMTLTIKQLDGTVTSQTTGGATTASSSSIIKGAEEVKSINSTGRQSWWEIFQ